MPSTLSDTMRVRASLGMIVLYFGASMPLYKIASRSFGPATTNLVRFLVAASMLMIIARRRLPSDRRVRRQLIVIGMFGLGLMAVLMGIGVDEGSAIIGSVIVGLEPIGVSIAAMVFAGDRPPRRTLLALGVGFTGALVASGLFTERTGSSPVLPVVLLLGTVVAFSVYTAMVRKVGRGVDPLATSALTQVGALAFALPACLFDIGRGGMVRGDIAMGPLVAALLLGVGSGISYLLLCVLLADQPASRFAVTLYLTPLIGVLTSWLVVNESLHWRDAAGAALVLLAIGISEFHRSAPEPAGQQLVAG